jgi:RHS repeat-associated protein
VRAYRRAVVHLLLFVFGLDGSGALALARSQSPAPSSRRPISSPAGRVSTRAARTAPAVERPAAARTAPVAAARPVAQEARAVETAAEPSRPSRSGGSCADDLRDGRTPSVSVAHRSLWPPNHALVDVGLGVGLTDPCEDQVSTRLQVWSDEADPPGPHHGDARIVPPDLFLRRERLGPEDGRVYLVILTATEAGGVSGTSCATVVVPHCNSQACRASVNSQAAQADAYCEAHDTAPPGFVKLAEKDLVRLNLPPQVDAGPDQGVVFPGPAHLDGTVTDDGQPCGHLSIRWTKVSGPGQVTFVNSHVADTDATFSQTGTYVLRLTADDSRHTVSDDVTIVVNEQNAAPTVDAGPDLGVTLPATSVELQGSASDDGFPSGQLTTTWTVVSGPGPVTFGNPASPVTTASFTVLGEYELRLTADDTQFTASDDMRVVVSPEPPPVLTPSDAALAEGHDGVTGAIVEVTLSRPWPRTVTVDFMTFDGTATPGCDYRPQFGTLSLAPGETSAQVLVPVVGELVAEADETVHVRFGNVTEASLARDQAILTIQNDDDANEAPVLLPGRAPANGATGVTLPPTLAWAATDPDAGDTLTHDVYLGTSFSASGQSWTRVCPATTGPGPRSGAVSGYDEANDRLILFGGDPAAGSSGTLWVLANATGAGGAPAWTPIETSGGPAGLRRAAAAYDAATNRLVVHGGCVGTCESALADTWVLSNANGLGGPPEWTLVTGAGPGPRVGAAAAYDAASGRLLVFGGSDGSAGSERNDVWSLGGVDGSGPLAWTPLPVAGAAPAPRQSSSAVYDPEARRLVVFGGLDGDAHALGDVWVLTGAGGAGDTPAWVALQPAGPLPGRRFGHAAAFDAAARRMLVFGGTTAPAGASNFVFGDAWMLTETGTTAQWIRLSPAGLAPLARFDASAAYSASHNRIVLAGGANNRLGDPDDVWMLADAMGSLPLVSADQPDASYLAEGLTPGAQYFWRTVTRDSHGAWRGSVAWRFTSNRPPLVEAGPDQAITLPASHVTLTGTASDDGLPSGTLVLAWSLASGPAPVVFSDPASPVTDATFTAPGSYVLRLTADDSQLQASDQLTVTVSARPAAGRTYTLDADFDLGRSVNVAHDVPDQLRLKGQAGAFQFIWVAVSTKGTIVKIDTRTGQVLGEYRTAPQGQPTDTSRTTVDLNGNVWTANRAGNSVVHVGLVENGQCQDRNGNGTIETSTGLGDFRPWPNTNDADTTGGVSTAADECILHYTRVNSSGTRHLSVTTDNDVWVSGTGGQRFDLLDGATGLIKRTEPSVGFGGYGGLIDRNGVIWSARPLLRWDTSRSLTGPNGGSWTGHGHDSYGLCIDPQGNVWETALQGNVLRKWSPGGALLGSFGHGNFYAQGCAVDPRGDVWVAHSLVGPFTTVGHVKNNGQYVGNVAVGVGPTGVSVDADGKVWATNYNSGTVSRIDPNAGPIGADGATRVGAVDLTTVNLGGNTYNYSDMTGSTLTGAPQTGSWSVVFDSGLPGAVWGGVRWTASVCGDGSLGVAVATSADGVTFGPDRDVVNGGDPDVPDGRYARVTVTFRRASTGESPTLYDLSLGTVDFPLPADAPNAGPSVSAGPDQSVVLPQKGTLQGAACDDGLPAGSALAVEWSQVGGPGTMKFDRPDRTRTGVTFRPANTFEAAGDFSGTLNPNGPWTYGWSPTRGGPFTPGVGTTDAGLPAWRRALGGLPGSFPVILGNPTDQTVYVGGLVPLRADSLLLHPGPAGENAVVRWTAAAAGSYRIEGRFQGIDPAGTSSDVAVLRNGTALFSRDVNGSAESAPFAIVQSLDAGDVLAFTVGFGTNGNYNSDSTALHLRISPAQTSSVSGTYVARLTAGDSEQQASDDVTVDVVAPGCAPAAAEVLAWWPADGDPRDIAGGRDATLTGGAGFGPGMAGSAFALDGADDTVTVPAHPRLNVTGSFTLEAWVNPQGLNVQRPVVEYGAPGVFGVHLWLNVNQAATGVSPGSLYANIVDSGGGFHILGSVGGLVASNVWSHVALTYDRPAGLARLYVNGAPVATSQVGSFTPRTNVDLNIGYRPNGGQRFFGSIDEVTLVGRALSAAEIRAIHSSGSLGKCRDINQRPLVDAGPDLVAAMRCAGPAEVTLGGTVSDDGQPPGAPLVSGWVKASGPGTVAFADAGSPVTTATFSSAGAYVLRLTANDSVLSGSDEVRVNVAALAAPSGPHVASGVLPSQLGGGPAPVTVTGLLPGRAYSLFMWGSWAFGNGVIGNALLPGTLVSGFGNVSIVGQSTAPPYSATAPLVIRRFEATGTSVTMTILDSNYGDNVGQLEFQLYEGELGGQSLAVSAGPDVAILWPEASVALSGVATAYGVPASGITVQWSLVTGPGTVTFGDAAQLATTAQFSAPGTYELQLRVVDCVRAATDTVTVTVADRSDLVVQAVDVSAVVTDGQTLAVSGSVAATVANIGGGPAPGAFTVTFFEDRNGNGTFEPAEDNPLGAATRDGLPPGGSAVVTAAVAGSVLFLGNLVHAFVDSGHAVPEGDESNNYGRSGPPCEAAPGPRPFAPRLEWSWRGSTSAPDSRQVMMAPIVIDLDGDGFPEVAFTTYQQGSHLGTGVLRVIDGRNGGELFSVTDPALGLAPLASLAAGDIDGDGRPEIVGTSASGNRLLAFEHDGSLKWTSPPLESSLLGPGPAITDLEGDGGPEILVGRQVLRADGSLRWRGTGGRGGPTANGYEAWLPLAADVDLDGVREVVAGNTVYRATGAISWQAAGLPDGYNAVGNFDPDDFAEIVLVSDGKVWLLEHTGQVKWGPVVIPEGGQGGPPTVADLDGDGQPEIGVAGASRYVVLEHDGTVKWSSPIQDATSHVTGSSVFDFEGDGSDEVVYADELKLRVFRGQDGAVLFESTLGSGTGLEYPLVVDVDGDGHAEIVAVANQFLPGPNNGVFVYGDDTWVATRRVWHQHTYHITNINDDGTIPLHERPSWLTYNSYRQNRLTSGCEFARPDLVPSFVRATLDGTTRTLTARIGNGGGSAVPAGVPVAFYDRSPSAGGTLLGTATTAALLAPGRFEDVTLTVPLAARALPLWVAADDLGNGQGTQDESDETNNTYNSGLFVSDQPNTAPDVSAGPDQRLVHPTTVATLDGTVTDDGLPVDEVTVSWGKVSGPGAVVFADATAADTTATFGAPGTYVLRLAATDQELQDSDDVTVVVEPPNQAPTVSAGPDQSISGRTAQLDGTVSDDGLPTGGVLTFTWTQVSGPVPALLAAPTAVDTAVTFGEAGTYTFRLTASDSALSASDEVSVEVAFVNQAPVVNGGPDRSTTLPTSVVALDGTVTDDGLPVGGTLTATWLQVSGPGAVTFADPASAATTATFPGPGTYVVRLRAGDGELTARDDVTVLVFGTAPSGAPPVAAISSPAPGTRITAAVDVFGTARSDTLAGWQLEYRLDGDPTFTRFASGTAPVENARLGGLDPSLLLNGIFEVRLSVTDTSGRTARASTTVVVKENLKIGQFTVSFVDLEVPVAGLPIRVTRTYDSRDKRRGDFGVGWRLDLSSISIGETGTSGLGWQGISTGGPFPSYCVQATAPHVVTVSLPDGKVHEFEMVLTPQCQPFIPPQFATVSYRPMGDPLGSLAAADGNEVFVVASWPGPVDLYDASTFEVFDPTLYRYTAPDGRTFLVHQTNGLRELRDLNGNVLTVGPNGVTHSSGAGISFQRDPQGRIRAITDPSGNAMAYGYDPAGDLVSYTDREVRTTTFTYNPDVPHHLDSIRDPLGRTPIRNEYYDDGRLKSHTDALGKTITYVHDLTNRQEVVTDRNGGVRVMAYDSRGNVVRETDQEGKVVLRTFNARNNRKSETLPHEPGTPNPPATLFAYENEGLPTETDNLAGITDPAGRETRFTYNARQQVLTVRDARGHFTVNTYDAKGNLLVTEARATEAGPALSRTAHTYFPNGDLESQRIWTDIAGDVSCATTYEYFPQGWLKKETDALGHATEYTYDATGNRRTQTTTRTLPGGGTETLVTEYVYNRLGQLTKTVDPDLKFTETVYDEMGRTQDSYDRNRNKTSFTYDDMGRLFRTTFPDLTFEEITYFPEGQRKTVRDRRGKVTSFEYDGVGRLRMTTYADGVFTENVYDAAGRLETALDGRRKITRHEYFPDGRRKATDVQVGGTPEAPVFARTAFTYDASGNLETLTDPRGKTTSYVHDALNRRTRTVFPPAGPGAPVTTAETAYDSAGRKVAETDQAGKVTRFGYDCLGQLTSVTQTDAGVALVTTHTYDELGNRIAQTDARDHTTRFEHDRLGRETRRVLPDGRFEARSYDDAGNLATRVDPNLRTTTFSYDVNNRLRLREYAGGAQPPVAFTYTPTGRRETVAVGGADPTRYEYDDRGRLRQLTYPDGRTLAYAWDGNGNLTSLTATIGALSLTTGLTHDDASRLDVVTDPVGRLHDHGYDLNGNRQSLVHPNGTRTDYAYDDLNRLTSLGTTRPSAGTTIQSYAFTLGPGGNRTRITEAGATVREYGYDDLYRLKTERVTINGLVDYEKAFTYDAVGNRLTQATIGSGPAGSPAAPGTLSYGHDVRDRLETETGTLAGQPVGITYGYDDNGNLLTKSGEATYAWDFEDRLVRVTKADGTLVEHAYDADGNRMQTKTTAAGGGTTTVNFLVDVSGPLAHVVAETDQAGRLTAYYVRGDDLLAVMRPLVPAPAAAADWQTRVYHVDGVGSVRRLTDEAGLITDGYTYTAFGEPVAHTGSDPQPYAFAGEPYDPNVGFQYHRARWMDPRVGRFVGTDPLQGREHEPLTLHRYLYAGVDPVDRVDPSGLDFSLASSMTATTIATTISSVQLNIGMAVVDQLLYGGNAGLESLAMGVVAGAAIFGVSKLGLRLLHTSGFKRFLERVFRTKGVRPNVGIYDDVAGAVPGMQANHLNQDAAFKSVIPSGQGAAVGMRGNAFTDIGSPHYEFHRALEEFWEPFRKGGSRFGSRPTCADYDDALRQALLAAGYEGDVALSLAEFAAQNRRSFGLLDASPVPRIPGRLPQKK